MEHLLKNQKNKLHKSILNILIFIILILFNVNLYAKVYAKESKFKSSNPFFYETPTRFIIIIDNIGEAPPIHCTKNVGCADAYYFEINKQTGKSLKLKGKQIIQSHTYNFQGYTFKYKNLYYSVYSSNEFVIDKIGPHGAGDETILKEPIIY